MGRKGALKRITPSTDVTGGNEDEDLEQQRTIPPKRRNMITSSSNSDSSKLMEEVIKINQAINQTNNTMVSNFKEVKEAVFQISTAIKKVEENVEQLNVRVGINENTISSHQSEIEYLQIQARRLNLIIVGIAESLGESSEMLSKKVQDLFTKTLEINDIAIPTDGCFRFGKSRPGNPRNIKVKLCTELHRETILAKRNLLKDKKLNIFINEDLPYSVMTRRRQLRLERNKARLSGKQAQMKGDLLIIDKNKYKIENGTLIQVNSAYQQRQQTTQSLPASFAETASSSSSSSTSHSL